jgi:pyruvate kinase
MTYRAEKPTPPREALGPHVLKGLHAEVEELRRWIIDHEAAFETDLERVHPAQRASARNLVHYLAMRQTDVRALQVRLAQVGLSSLGRSEAHVLVSLDRLLAMLALARGQPFPSYGGTVPPVGFRHGEGVLRRNAERLLGPPREQRDVRIMVTLPSEAATDPQLVRGMMCRGMDCARINCAHDDPDVWSRMIENVRSACREVGGTCRVVMDLGGPKLRTGAVRGTTDPPRVRRDELLAFLTPKAFAAREDRPEAWVAEVECAVPEIFRDARVGERVWVDDGKIGGTIVEKLDDLIVVRVARAKQKGQKLRPEKGINLPDTDLVLPALTPKDREDLRFVARHADAVGLSFVNRPKDVESLIDALEESGADDLGVILKIETTHGFRNLPLLLLTAMRRPYVGVMIARGDLAVEAGFERLAELQEEVLWIAEAAHVPTIWATQVLETLAKTGVPSRAEVTDAAMSGRAEAVMLNKGDYILDAITSLDDILARMREHRSKKRQLLRALSVSQVARRA